MTVLMLLVDHPALAMLAVAITTIICAGRGI